MKTLRRSTPLLLTLFCIFSLESAWTQEVSLEYKFKPGERDRYKSVTRNQMASAAMPGGGMEMTMEQYMTQRTDSVDASGVRYVVMTIDSMTRMMNNQKMSAAGMEALLNKPMKIKISKRGEYLDISAPDDQAAQMKPFLESMRQNAKARGAFPDHPVKAGDSWEDSSDVTQNTPTGPQTFTVKTKQTFVGFERYAGYDCAVIRVSGTLSGGISGQMKGTQFFAHKIGKMVKTFLETDMMMSMDTPSGPNDMSVKTSVTSELQK